MGEKEIDKWGVKKGKGEGTDTPDHKIRHRFPSTGKRVQHPGKKMNREYKRKFTVHTLMIAFINFVCMFTYLSTLS